MTRHRVNEEDEGDEELHYGTNREYPANEMDGQHGEGDTWLESKRKMRKKGTKNNGGSKDKRKPRLKKDSNAEGGSFEPVRKDSFFEM